MYNPYNWKIKKEMHDEKSDLKCNCILEELGCISNELDMTRARHVEVKNELSELNKKIIQLEEKKRNIFNKILE